MPEQGGDQRRPPAFSIATWQHFGNFSAMNGKSLFSTFVEGKALLISTQRGKEGLAVGVECIGNCKT